jgi:predicted branched-subunit amino acid permease
MSSYRRGLVESLPFLLVVAPFALIFGVVATEAGLSVFETLSFSVIVIAGAAQFTAVQLMLDQAPLIVVLVSALAVNLRMAVYSAAMTPHLGALPLWKRAAAAYFLVDLSYAAAALDYDRNRGQTLAQKWGYFLGVSTVIVPPWYIFTLVGAWAGTSVPEGIGLDLAVPLAFIAMIGPALQTGPTRLAAAVGALGALGFAWLPYNLGLLVGGLGGMMAGAELERRQSRAAPDGPRQSPEPGA